MRSRLKVEKARVGDAEQMHRLINYFATRDEMLPRALSEIYENIRDFFVVRDEGQVVGCVSLHVNWIDLAEIKALAVAKERQERGIGSLLVKACLDEAKSLGIPTIFCLTYKPDFFGIFGFHQTDKMELPRKIWAECYKCPKFPNCDEVAMIIHLGTESEHKDEY